MSGQQEQAEAEEETTAPEVSDLSFGQDNDGSFIQFSKVNVFYGDMHVLKDITLGINEQEITVIMGPSGCGKSTFIRTLNRMNDTIPNFRHTGKISIKGVDIYSSEVDPVLLKVRVGMVFQKPNPFPISIYDNVAFGPKIHRMVKKKNEMDEIVEEALRRAALWEEVKDRLRDNAMKLSGGQQQRLCIARALSVRPEILLLDEPASALDPGSTSKIEELMVDLKRNYTVILVTHNMQQAARVANKVAFLYGGALVEVGKSPRIFENPANELTERYISGRLV
ncbi:MAG TPA: phosphate ABC transporter ATP-binding protein PstB [Nitrososphaerales archaeon]|nr:phosphate ABC transporter ATP-binding protein PstB [Nitrososphaerales archaeon]